MTEPLALAVVGYLMFGLTFGASCSIIMWLAYRTGEYTCPECGKSEWCRYDNEMTLLCLFAWPYALWLAYKYGDR